MLKHLKPDTITQSLLDVNQERVLWTFYLAGDYRIVT